MRPALSSVMSPAATMPGRAPARRTSSASVAIPSMAVAAHPDVSTRSMPRPTTASSASNASRVKSNARWKATSRGRAASTSVLVTSASTVPSGWSAPITMPFAPRSRAVAMSRRITASSVSSYTKSPLRGRISTNRGIPTCSRTAAIIPAEGVVPPSSTSAHNSIRPAPPPCAASAEATESTDTSIRTDIPSSPDDAERRARAPRPAGEVGTVDRTAALADRPLRERGHGAPCGAVVHVQVQGLTGAQALHQAVVLDEIHAPVARAAGALLERPPHRVLELRPVRRQILPAVRLAATCHVDPLLRVLPHQAPGALQQDLAAVRARRVGVVHDEDRLAGRGADQRADHVAERVGLPRRRAVHAVALRRPQVEAPSAGRHRHQVVEPVAAIHVEPLRHRTQAVRRIQVAVAADGMAHPPVPLVEIGELELAQIVEVAALGVQQLAEQSLPHHVEDHHLGAVVAAVLH